MTSSGGRATFVALASRATVRADECPLARAPAESASDQVSKVSTFVPWLLVGSETEEMTFQRQSGPFDPPLDCDKCPRLVQFHQTNRGLFPDFHNAPVPAFGPMDAPLVVVGLAPGLKGANRTGRPFTGDYAGDLLYPTLAQYHFARGQYGAAIDDGFELTQCRITNAVRCVPPENKPTPEEAKNCRPFLVKEIAAMTQLKAILCLGNIAHEAALRGLDLKPSGYKFAHGHQHQLPNGLVLFDSYHTTRYNVNTGRLTPSMFQKVVASIRQFLDS